MRILSMSALLALLCSAPVAAQQPAAWSDPGSGIEFVWMPRGCFQMGTNEPHPHEPGRDPIPPMPNEFPRHEACVDGFWMGKLEVTRAQWQKVMRGSPDGVTDPRHPAAYVTWEDAQLFLERLNAQGGGKRFRLPTEAEWEYACRAGAPEVPPPPSRSEADPLLEPIAWYHQVTVGSAGTREVATLAPNAWGLHDMIGNVLEWVQDSYLENGYTQHAKHNPKVTTPGDRFVLRGGSFKSEWWNARCGARFFGVPADRSWVIGLRVAREADK